MLQRHRSPEAEIRHVSPDPSKALSDGTCRKQTEACTELVARAEARRRQCQVFESKVQIPDTD